MSTAEEVFNEEFFPISPINFFQIGWECPHVDSGVLFQSVEKKLLKYKLPDLSALCADEEFGDVFMGWNEEGLEFVFKVGKKVEEVSYPDIVRGDSIEIFLDTRDVKTSGYNTRFCHHFFFLPEAVESHQKGERTHFRTEDAHELCNPAELYLKVSAKSDEYVLHIKIPKSCLNGYDPEQFNRLGFTYRINRPRWQSQHFSVITEDYQLEQQPSLWSSLVLVK